jgi:hypothetical protein
MRTTWTGSIAIGTTTTSGALNVNGTVTATTSRARIQTAVSGLTGIGTANLSGISGTPSSSTYLRGDGTWATASSGTTTGAGAANYIARAAKRSPCKATWQRPRMWKKSSQ